nr:soluble neuropilin 2a2 [Danio rerio]
MDFWISHQRIAFIFCFVLKVSAKESETCGGHLDASGAGYITSPGYPLEYPPHQSCQWVISAPEPSQRIVLNFNPHFELERLDCR